MSHAKEVKMLNSYLYLTLHVYFLFYRPSEVDDGVDTELQSGFILDRKGNKRNESSDNFSSSGKDTDSDSDNGNSRKKRSQKKTLKNRTSLTSLSGDEMDLLDTSPRDSQKIKTIPDEESDESDKERQNKNSRKRKERQNENGLLKSNKKQSNGKYQKITSKKKGVSDRKKVTLKRKKPLQEKGSKRP